MSAPAPVKFSLWLVTLLLVGCEAGPNPSVEAPSGLSYVDEVVDYPIGYPVAFNIPLSRGGPIDSYSVSPALPKGLTLQQQTGVIWGTPTVVTPAGLYTVTASNVAGQTTVMIGVGVVNAPPASVTFSKMNAEYLQNYDIEPNVPTLLGGGVATAYDALTLPDGLTMNSTTGVITGRPTVLTRSTHFVISAANSGGERTCLLVLSVVPSAPGNLRYPTVIKLTSSTSVQVKPTCDGSPATFSIDKYLPSGVYLDSQTGEITGHLSYSGDLSVPTTYVISATNPQGKTTAMVTLSR